MSARRCCCPIISQNALRKLMQINGTAIEPGKATPYNEGFSAVIRHV
jgi:hypothetical protein